MGYFCHHWEIGGYLVLQLIDMCCLSAVDEFLSLLKQLQLEGLYPHSHVCALVQNLSKFFQTRCTLPYPSFLSLSRHKPLMFFFLFWKFFRSFYTYLSVLSFSLQNFRKHVPKNALGSLLLSAWSADDEAYSSIAGPPLRSLPSAVIISFHCRAISFSGLMGILCLLCMGLSEPLSLWLFLYTSFL